MDGATALKFVRSGIRRERRYGYCAGDPSAKSYRCNKSKSPFSKSILNVPKDVKYGKILIARSWGY